MKMTAPRVRAPTTSNSERFHGLARRRRFPTEGGKGRRCALAHR
jgi:hypothetical protein